MKVEVEAAINDHNDNDLVDAFFELLLWKLKHRPDGQEHRMAHTEAEESAPDDD